MQKVGQMRLSEARLPGQQRDTQRPPLDPAEQFLPEPIMHLREIHLWIVRNQQWPTSLQIFCQKSANGGLANILCVQRREGKSRAVEKPVRD